MNSPASSACSISVIGLGGVRRGINTTMPAAAIMMPPAAKKPSHLVFSCWAAMRVRDVTIWMSNPNFSDFVSATKFELLSPFARSPTSPIAVPCLVMMRAEALKRAAGNLRQEKRGRNERGNAIWPRANLATQPHHAFSSGEHNDVQPVSGGAHKQFRREHCALAQGKAEIGA